MARQQQATYPLVVNANWKLKKVVRWLMRECKSFRVHYPEGNEGDITIFVLKEDMETVRQITRTSMLLAESIDLDDAKREMADCIRDCLEADDDSAYLIALINEGHGPTSWADGGEEVLYATEDEDDDSRILLHIKAKSET